MEYIVYYDVDFDEPSLIWPLTILSISLISVSIFLYKEVKVEKIFIHIGIGFISFLMMLAGIANYFEVKKAKEILNSGKAQVVEGRIKDFKPWNNRNKSESFTVEGEKFHYSSRRFNVGNSNLINDNPNGPVRQSLRVRIHYTDQFSNENTILKLEIPKNLN